MRAADTNLFLYAANPASEYHDMARRFFASVHTDIEFVVCELVIVEIYLQLRNPAVMKKPLSSKEAATFCLNLKKHPTWQHVDYCQAVSDSLWEWALNTSAGFRRIIDARLALTLRHHGVSEFATANTRDFQGFGFARVWNPLEAY